MTVTTLPALPSAWAPLETALRQRRPLRLAYHGRQRLVCPHALGWKNGRPMLLGYQTNPSAHTTLAPTDSRPGWRCMYIDEIASIDTASPDSAWDSADSYNPARPFPAIDHVTIAI
jgi:hypothetical protein